VQIRYVAYDHVPGIGGVSGFVDVPLPLPNNGTIVCLFVYLPVTFATRAVVLLTLNTAIGRDGTDGGGTAWVHSTTNKKFRACVDNPTFSKLTLNWAAFGDEVPPPPPDTTPTSCWAAKAKAYPNTRGALTSGEYILLNTDPELPKDDPDTHMYTKVYCDMEVGDGTGWMLVGNVPSYTGFLPNTVGEGRNLLAENATFLSQNYDSRSWNKTKPYWIRHVSLNPKAKVLFVTGDRQVSCGFDVRELRHYLSIGQPANVPVAFSLNTRVQAGQLTSVTNELPEHGGRVLIGCEGDFADNKENALWAHNAPSDWSCFVNRHFGVGVFVQ